MNLDIEIPINHIWVQWKNHQKTGKYSLRCYSNEFVLRFLSPFLWKLDYPDESLSQIKTLGKQVYWKNAQKYFWLHVGLSQAVAHLKANGFQTVVIKGITRSTLRTQG